jgi:hypothetical protein
MRSFEIDTYDASAEMYKELLNGPSSLFRPSHTKLEPFGVYSPEAEKLGEFAEPNEYISNPIFADSYQDTPKYENEFLFPINITKDRVEKFMFHWKLRLYFKQIKKEFTQKMLEGDYSEEMKNKLAEFHDYVNDELFKEKLKNIKTSNFNEPIPNVIVHDDYDKASFYEYWKLIYSRRPQLKKAEQNEFNYDFDFPVDVSNYDPWTEYKLIYRDAFLKGRKYWLLKAMPEWYFLQIGKPYIKMDDSSSEYNPKRFNMKDSIFNIIAIERWRDERREKKNIYNRDSQSIRI